VRRNKKIRGLYTSAAWYDAEYQAPADLSDFFLSYMPYTYNTTKAIEGAIMKGMYAITDDELAAAGRNISKVVRDSAIRKMLWASHYPWGLSKRITRWDPQIGANPPSAFETIELKQ
jgi:hypothetical protein